MINNYSEKIGKVIECTKSIEYLLNCIISNHVTPYNYAFFHDIILNSNIISMGAKIKILQTICKEKEIKENFNDLHKLINLRNLFAHEISYVDTNDRLEKIDQLKSNGEYLRKEFNHTFNEFTNLFNKEHQHLTILLGKLNETHRSII